MTTDQQARMPLWQHLSDLRHVLVRCLLALLLGSVIGYLYCEPVVAFLEKPLLSILPPSEAHLYYLGITEKFMVYFKVSLLEGAILVSPYLLYQIWWFVAPALYKHERRFLIPFLGFGTFAFLLGAGITYFAILPSMYKFLIGIGTSGGEARIRLSQYFTLTLKMLFLVGAAFEVPVLIVLLGKFGLVDRSTLTRYRKHAILALAVLAAFISPTPDALSMVIVWAPLWLFYELSVFLVGWAGQTANT